MLSSLYNTPLKIPYLIVGMQGLGIGNVKNDFCVSKQFKEHLNDPVECFVNRMYLRYNIKRNTFINKVTDLPINIIYILNIRPYHNINLLFDKLRNDYSNMSTFTIIDWSQYSFKEQLNILNTTNIMICGVGTARGNTPFLPNYSIEIQTNTHSLTLPNNIDYLDFHIGTLSNYIKVINIEEYTVEESRHNLYSHKLEKIIDDSINMTTNNSIKNINIDDNIPQYVLNLRNKVDETTFKNWRNSLSNGIGHLIQVLLRQP
jgi:hypothetical protein